MDYYFNKRGVGYKSTYLDYYFNKREGKVVGGGDKSTYLDYFLNKREGGGGIRIHIGIITLIIGRGGG